MPKLNTVPIFYNDKYVAPSTDFDTLRKSALIAERIPELIHDPSCMVDEAIKQIKKAHSPQYVKALMTGEMKQIGNLGNGRQLILQNRMVI